VFDVSRRSVELFRSQIASRYVAEDDQVVAQELARARGRACRRSDLDLERRRFERLSDRRGVPRVLVDHDGARAARNADERGLGVVFRDRIGRRIDRRQPHLVFVQPRRVGACAQKKDVFARVHPRAARLLALPVHEQDDVPFDVGSGAHRHAQVDGLADRRSLRRADRFDAHARPPLLLEREHVDGDAGQRRGGGSRQRVAACRHPVAEQHDSSSGVRRSFAESSPNGGGEIGAVTAERGALR
jgi:hypothetical protein